MKKSLLLICFSLVSVLSFGQDTVKHYSDGTSEYVKKNDTPAVKEFDLVFDTVLARQHQKKAIKSFENVVIDYEKKERYNIFLNKKTQHITVHFMFKDGVDVKVKRTDESNTWHWIILLLGCILTFHLVFRWERYNKRIITPIEGVLFAGIVFGGMMRIGLDLGMRLGLCFGVVFGLILAIFYLLEKIEKKWMLIILILPVVMSISQGLTIGFIAGEISISTILFCLSGLIISALLGIFARKILNKRS